MFPADRYVICPTTVENERALRRLAELDSRPVSGRALIAEIGRHPALGAVTQRWACHRRPVRLTMTAAARVVVCAVVALAALVVAAPAGAATKTVNFDNLAVNTRVSTEYQSSRGVTSPTCPAGGP